MKRAALFALLALCLAGAAAATRDLTVANPCAGKKNGTIIASAGCSATYFQCWMGKAVRPSPKCAAPLVFNPAAKPPGCSFVGAIGTTNCNCRRAYTGEKAAACSVCQRMNKAGSYALVNKPWPRYVECSEQGPFVMPCNPPLKWIPAKKACA